MSTIISGVFADKLQGMLTSALFIIFVVLVLGYMLGRINIKGVELGSSGVFIAALIVGIIIAEAGDKIGFDWEAADFQTIAAIRNLGLGMFVAGIGFIAGPTFFRNFKKNAASFVGIGATVIAVATIFCILLIAIDTGMEAYQGVGILMGALSSTPGLSAAQGVFSDNATEVAALSGLAYPFGVLGVVLFVQLLPRVLRVDMAEEVEKFRSGANKKSKRKLREEAEAAERRERERLAAEAEAAARAAAEAAAAAEVTEEVVLAGTITSIGYGKNPTAEDIKRAAARAEVAHMANEFIPSYGSKPTFDREERPTKKEREQREREREEERAAAAAAAAAEMAAAAEAEKKRYLTFDPLGIAIFAMAVALGMLAGAITIPLGGKLTFSLGTTGGALLAGLLFSHFGKAGKLSLNVPKPTISVMRELGLVFFLTCSGIEGGFKFFGEFHIRFLFYGMILTIVPILAAFAVARYLFRLELLNNLGSICGGMTSTPALGALIHVSKTEEVAQSYAATYPIALLLLIFVPQLISIIFH